MLNFQKFHWHVSRKTKTARILMKSARRALTANRPQYIRDIKSVKFLQIQHKLELLQLLKVLKIRCLLSWTDWFSFFVYFLVDHWNFVGYIFWWTKSSLWYSQSTLWYSKSYLVNCDDQKHVLHIWKFVGHKPSLNSAYLFCS